MIRRPPRSPFFPSTPLSRSRGVGDCRDGGGVGDFGGAAAFRRYKAAGADPARFHHPDGVCISTSRRGERSIYPGANAPAVALLDRKSTRLNSSHLVISYAVF